MGLVRFRGRRGPTTAGDIARTAGIGVDEVEKLRSAGIASIDALWKRVGERLDDGIETLAGETGLSSARLMELLAKQAVAEDAWEDPWAPDGPDGWLKVSIGRPLLGGAMAAVVWFASAVGIATLAAACGLALVLRATLFPPKPAHDTAAVRAATGLPPFHIIESKDIRAMASSRDVAASAARDVIGRYTVKAVTSGQVVRRDDLGAVHLSAGEIAALHGRQILTLPLDAGGVSAAAVPGAHVQLVFSASSPATRPSQAVIGDVIVLAVDGDRGRGATLVGAVTTADLSNAVPLLGRSRVVVLQPIR
jgi:hypothetical protein